MYVRRNVKPFLFIRSGTGRGHRSATGACVEAGELSSGAGSPCPPCVEAGSLFLFLPYTRLAGPWTSGPPFCLYPISCKSVGNSDAHGWIQLLHVGAGNPILCSKPSHELSPLTSPPEQPIHFVYYFNQVSSVKLQEFLILYIIYILLYILYIIDNNPSSNAWFVLFSPILQVDLPLWQLWPLMYKDFQILCSPICFFVFFLAMCLTSHLQTDMLHPSCSNRDVLKFPQYRCLTYPLLPFDHKAFVWLPNNVFILAQVELYSYGSLCYKI